MTVSQMGDGKQEFTEMLQTTTGKLLSHIIVDVCFHSKSA